MLTLDRDRWKVCSLRLLAEGNTADDFKPRVRKEDMWFTRPYVLLPSIAVAPRYDTSTSSV